MARKLLSILLLIFTLWTLPHNVFALDSTQELYKANESRTSTGMRMEPIVTKYNSFTSRDIEASEKLFTDISGHFAKTYIAKLSALELISGYGNGKFGPNDTLLAGQYIKMVVSTLGFTPDIPNKGKYWEPYVDIAINEGLLYSGEIKDFVQPISRELAGTIGLRALLKYTNYPSEDQLWLDYNKSKISDYAHIADMYKQDILLCYRMGILQGHNNIFEPKGTLTRAQAAIIMIRLIDKNIREESVPNPSEVINYKFRTDFNEPLFAYTIKAGQEYTIYPGYFPLNEIYDVFKTMYSSLGKGKGHRELDYCGLNYNFSTVQYIDKAQADRFYLKDNTYPLYYACFTVYLTRCYEKDKLNSIGDGFLYSLNVFNVPEYDKQMTPYTYSLFDTLFKSDAKRAVELHDMYLNNSLQGKPYSEGVYFLNNRRVYMFSGPDVLGIEIYAQGAIKQ